MSLTTLPKLTAAATDPELLRLWMSQKAATTQATYLLVARQFLRFTGKDLRETQLEDVLLWLESFHLRGFSQHTLNNKLAALKSLFSFGTKTGYLAANIPAFVKTPHPKDALNERLLVEAEVRTLIAAAQQGRDRTLLTLLYVLGLRVSELVGLNWSDFRATDSGAVVTIFGKGSKTRSLLLDQRLWAEVQALPRSDNTEAVFLSRFGNRLDRHAVHRIVKATASRAGINPQISAHWLRHAHACHSLKNGAGVDLLMKSLGHSSLSVTSRYLHCQPSECTSTFIHLEFPHPERRVRAEGLEEGS
jgi:integrase/recombinase XerD